MDQVRRKLAVKRTWRKPVRDILQRGFNTLSYLLSNTRYSKQFLRNSDLDLELGTDEFGRDVATNLSAYVQLLKNRGIKLHTVVILGSRAKGRWKLTSDVDVLVIADGLPNAKYDRWFTIRDNPINMCADMYGCSREEFLQYLNEFRILALDAMCYGKTVFDDGFWSKVAAHFKELEDAYHVEKSEIRRILSAV